MCVYMMSKINTTEEKNNFFETKKIYAFILHHYFGVGTYQRVHLLGLLYIIEALRGPCPSGILLQLYSNVKRNDQKLMKTI